MANVCSINCKDLIEKLGKYPPETEVVIVAGIYNRRGGEDVLIHDWSFDFARFIDNGHYKELRLPAKFSGDNDEQYVTTVRRKK